MEDETRLHEMYDGLSLMTVQERERMYTRKEVHKSLEAGEFLRSLGVLTGKEAVNILCDANALNNPHSVDNVIRLRDGNPISQQFAVTGLNPETIR